MTPYKICVCLRNSLRSNVYESVKFAFSVNLIITYSYSFVNTQLIFWSICTKRRAAIDKFADRDIINNIKIQENKTKRIG